MMTNKERYKQAFSVLHASDDISLEVKAMKNEKKLFKMKFAMAACFCAVMVCASATIAYAADIGGIQEKLHVWIHGEQAEVDVTANPDGGYTFSYTEDDQTHIVAAGGVSIDDSGKETPLSAEELADSFTNEVETKEDGSVWLYYRSLAVDITDYLQNGTCKLAYNDNGTMIYFDIADDNGGGYQLTRSTAPDGPAAAYTVIKETER